MTLNGWIGNWRRSSLTINRQVEIGQCLAVISPIPGDQMYGVGLKEQRSHVPVLSQLGDKPFCLLQLVAALCILRLLLSLRIAIASFSFLSFSSFSSLVASFYTFALSILASFFSLSFVIGSSP